MSLSAYFQIATRALIDPCLEKSIIIEENYPPLVQFLTVLEEVLLHGWKQKISMFNRNKSFWAVFDHKHMESAVPELKVNLTEMKKKKKKILVKRRNFGQKYLF